MKDKPIPRFLTNQITFQKTLKQPLHTFSAIPNSPPRVDSKSMQTAILVFIALAELKLSTLFQLRFNENLAILPKGDRKWIFCRALNDRYYIWN